MKVGGGRVNKLWILTLDIICRCHSSWRRESRASVEKIVAHRVIIPSVENNSICSIAP